MDIYQPLLLLHSLLRWVLLLLLLSAVLQLWLRRHADLQQLNPHILALRLVAGLQLLVGFVLYVNSPLIDYFMAHFSTAVHQRQIRFFGMEHSTVMFLCTLALVVLPWYSRFKPVMKQRRWLLRAFAIVLLIVLINIPFPFSPFAQRPWMRW